MSSYIKVNYQEFEKTASEIDSYISRHKKNMSKAETEIHSLGTSWKGEDYNGFVFQFTKLNAADSTSYAFIKALESYASLLRYSAGQYKEAQAEAIRKVNSL